MSTWKYDTKHKARRCGHAFCGGCKTRRGRNIGNRRDRHVIKTILRKVV